MHVYAIFIFHLQSYLKHTANGTLRARPPDFFKKVDGLLRYCDKNGITDRDYENNELHRTFSNLRTWKQKRTFVLACTNNLLLSHLSLKGFDTEVGCRLCSHGNESMGHFMACHLDTVALRPLAKRKAMKQVTKEARHPRKRPSLLPAADVALLLTNEMAATLTPKIVYKKRE